LKDGDTILIVPSIAGGNVAQVDNLRSACSHASEQLALLGGVWNARHYTELPRPVE
jgi:hypothetical protein